MNDYLSTQSNQTKMFDKSESAFGLLDNKGAAMMKSKTLVTKVLNNLWQDQCRVCEIDGVLVALPYREAMLAKDYEKGAIKAAMVANALISQLLVETNI